MYGYDTAVRRRPSRLDPHLLVPATLRACSDRPVRATSSARAAPCARRGRLHGRSSTGSPRRCAASRGCTSPPTRSPTSASRKPGSACCRASTASRAARRSGPGSSGSWSTSRRRGASARRGACPSRRSRATTSTRPTWDPSAFEPDGQWSTLPFDWRGLARGRASLGAETLAVIGRAIDALPPMQAEVIRLRDVLGWSSEEVRNALDLTDTNQRVLLHRARTKVRAAVEAHLRSVGRMTTTIMCRELLELISGYLDGALPPAHRQADRRPPRGVRRLHDGARGVPPDDRAHGPAQRGAGRRPRSAPCSSDASAGWTSA